MDLLAKKYAMRTNHETEGRPTVRVHIVCSEACEQVERNTVSGSIFEAIKGGATPYQITRSSLI